MHLYHMHMYTPCLQFTEQGVQRRTKEIYSANGRGLDGPLRSHIATTYGIANNSVLNKCQYFHVVNGLVPDIMHDILGLWISTCTRTVSPESFVMWFNNNNYLHVYICVCALPANIVLFMSLVPCLLVEKSL